MHTNHDFSANEYKNYESITLRGTKYIIPSDSYQHPMVTINKLAIEMGGQKHDARTEPLRLFLPEKIARLDELTLHVDSNDYRARDGVEVVLYLFREGTEQPIITFEDYVDFDLCTTVCATRMDGELTAGRYFLVGGNVKGEPATAALCTVPERLCYTFEIWPSGVTMEHPQLYGTEVHRKADDMRAGRFTSGTLRLYTELASSLFPYSKLSAVCYSEDWQLMAEGECIHPHGRGVHERIGVTLRSTHVWMEGRYTAILSHNEEPIAAIEFVYDGAAVMPCTVRQLSQTDVEYMLMKHVIRNNELRWYDVCRFSGMAEAKSQLIQAYCRRDFDALCQEYGISLRCPHRYAVITAPTDCSCYRLAELLPRYLHFGTSETDLISCRRYRADDIRDAFIDQQDKTVALTDIGALSTTGNDKIGEVEKAIEDMTEPHTILFVGTREEVSQLCRQSPIITKALAGAPRFDLTYPSIAELVDELHSSLCNERLVLSPESENAIAHQVMEHNEKLREWECDDYTHYIRSEVVGRLTRRVQCCIDEGHEVKAERLFMLHPSDFDLASYIQEQSSTSAMPIPDNDTLFEKNMVELNAMVGLKDLKAQLVKDFALIRFHEQRRRMGLPSQSGATHHMLFTGNPGTGKTTVAHLIGKIYYAMGYLSQGEVIAVDRTQLVGTHIGETEDKMSKLLKRAKGNVLFIDEAYALCDTTEDRKDFGYHVIEALLPVMAAPNPDMIVIFAGYADEMERLMAANQGLKGRFAHHLHFDDYTAGELMQIAHNLLAEHQYILADGAQVLLRSIVERVVAHKDCYFGNARWIKQFIESGILPAMASRVMHRLQATEPDRALLTSIEKDDVEAAERIYAPRQVALCPRPRIGFVA